MLVSIFITCPKTPCLPCNLHIVTTWCSPDTAIRKNTQHDTTRPKRRPCHAKWTWKSLKCCACHATSRWTHPKCCACHEKWKSSSENLATVLRVSHRTIFWRVMKHVDMSGSATLATRLHNVWNLQSGHFCSTPHRHGYRVPTAVVLPTVADGLRTQKQRPANMSQPPDPQSKTRTLRYAFGEKIDSTGVIGEGGCKQAVNKFPHAIKQDLRNVSESWAVAKLVWQTSWKHPTGYGTAWFQPIFGKSLGVVHWLVVCAL